MKEYIPIIATIIVLIGNIFVGKRNLDVSNFHQLSATPSKRTFSIWGIIYLGLLLLCIFKRADFIDETIILYVASCILNLLWLYVFLNCNKKSDNAHNDEHLVGGAFILIGIAICIFVLTVRSQKDSMMAYVFGIYSAWTIVASMLNIGIVLKEKNILKDSVIKYIFMILLSIIPFIINQLPIDSINKNSMYPITWLWASFGIIMNKYENKIDSNSLVFLIPLISNTIFAFIFILDRS